MTARQILLTAAGFALLAVGAVGAVVPLLPTTPFVLAASACFTVTPAIRARILRNRFFGEHMTNYQRRTGLRGQTVAVSLAFLWVTLTISMFAVKAPWCTALLTAVGVAVTIHILCIARAKRQ